MYSVLNSHIEPLLKWIATKGGLDDYKYLMGTLRQKDITADGQFQRIYRKYWEMGAARLGSEFYKAYFELLEELKAFEQPDLRQIAIHLSGIDSNSKGQRKLHFSFSTKILHMLQPEMPVYDSRVAQFYFLPEEGTTFDERLEIRLGSYEFLVAEYERVLNEGLLAPAITGFRKRFDLGDNLTATKIVDTLIWGFTAMLAEGVLKSGDVKYF